MLMKNKIKGAAIAAAAAGLLLSGCATNSHKDGGHMKMADSGDVHCMGINSCKGNTSCKSATNDCKGKNGCKGKGWLKTASKEACAEKGGTTM